MKNSKSDHIERYRLIEHGKTIGTGEMMKKINWAYFQHDMANGGYEYLPNRIASDNILHDKKFKFVCNPKYDEYQRGAASTF